MHVADDPPKRGVFMGKREVLSPEEKAAIAARIAKLPRLPDHVLDEIGIMLAAYRSERRRAEVPP
jgi:hypothetical protein